MTHDFDEDYWEGHWRRVPRDGRGKAVEPNPHLVREVGDLPPGTALEAGCGEGTEAIWLASRGWRVTAADISADVLARAAARDTGSRDAPTWVRADLTTWQPDARFDLVTTHYAHPATSQSEFHDRIAGWVAPGGTLLIVGHAHVEAHAHSGHGHTAGHGHTGREHAGGHPPPAEASATAAGITARLDPDDWEVVTAEERTRTLTAPDGRAVPLHDVVVRATRRR
ncbi:class I SAM-dependent methyltransferase [Saccharothrix yanglingensis]|uniref:SAM-dependent methyltransferase n=1 Tax=Saccharothrix yanglingensis TaxID=659496 RepID=A0ABU0WWR1_9PSEU|nr:class I SAM-dependent methyltransferase [Saccharothrix yanglingensis]MDQ2583938.1 SAM-dependent methyltransferase [Saccharothrix yanglingensis]